MRERVNEKGKEFKKSVGDEERKREWKEIVEGKEKDRKGREIKMTTLREENIGI